MLLVLINNVLYAGDMTKTAIHTAEYENSLKSSQSRIHPGHISWGYSGIYGNRIGQPAFKHNQTLVYDG